MPQTGNKGSQSGLLQKSIKYYLSKKNSFDNCQADFLWEIQQKLKNKSWGRGTLQKRICVCSITADSRQLILKLMSVSSYDVIINSRASQPTIGLLSLQQSRSHGWLRNATFDFSTLLPSLPHMSETCHNSMINHQHSKWYH